MGPPPHNASWRTVKIPPVSHPTVPVRGPGLLHPAGGAEKPAPTRAHLSRCRSTVPESQPMGCRHAVIQMERAVLAGCKRAVRCVFELFFFFCDSHELPCVHDCTLLLLFQWATQACRTRSKH